MKRKLYIAYGSNLSVEQMADRCPDARIAGKAALKDWALRFKVHADIEPCEGDTVPVLIWEISREDERRLDAYEGWPHYYVKKDISVEMTDLDGRNPRNVTAMAYVMTEGHGLRIPMRAYYEVLYEGYRRFGFDTAYLERAMKEAEEGHGYEFS